MEYELADLPNQVRNKITHAMGFLIEARTQEGVDIALQDFRELVDMPERRTNEAESGISP